MNNKITIIISILVFIIIMLMMVLIINQMEERFSSDCEKQNNMGIKSYWDVDIDCSQFYEVKNRAVS